MVGRTVAIVRVRSCFFVSHAVDDNAARLHLSPVIPKRGSATIAVAVSEDVTI